MKATTLYPPGHDVPLVYLQEFAVAAAVVVEPWLAVAAVVVAAWERCISAGSCLLVVVAAAELVVASSSAASVACPLQTQNQNEMNEVIMYGQNFNDYSLDLK